MLETLLNQLVYFGFFQCAFLLCVFLLSGKSRRNVNLYLLFLLIALFVGLGGRVLYISEIFGRNFRLLNISEFATLSFGASVFLFTRSSLYQKTFDKRELIHYLPAVVYMTAVIIYFMIPPNEVIIARSQSGELARAILLFAGVGLSFNLTYWVLSLKEFYRFRKMLREEVSYSVQTQFFLNFLIAIGLCFLPWIIVWLLNLGGFDKLERIVRPYIWITLAFIIMYIIWYNIVAPSVFKLAPKEIVRKYAQSKLSLDDLNNLKLELERLMIDKKPYLNKKLLKAELAEMMGISNPELARLLNENVGMNFFEFVNYYRIKEFIELSKTERAKGLTFFGIAQEAGFNSKTTFNKSFKKLMGTSPSNYFKQEI